MNNTYDYEQPLDPHLKEKLALLRSTPARDAHKAERTRQKFLGQLEAIPTSKLESTSSWLTRLFKPKTNNKEVSMNPKTQRFAFTTLAAVLLILVVLFGGAGATAYASQSALPGDALYPLKTSLEQTQLALARDAYQRALLHLDFAQRRLDEMYSLVNEGRYADIEKASNEFEAYVQRAIDELQVVMTADPTRGTDLSNRITQALLTYSMMLKNVLVKVPDTVRPMVERAMITSETSAGEETEFTGVVEAIGPDSWTISGQTVVIISLTEIKDVIEVGDTVKVHAILSPDGTLTAREIELSDDFEDGNDNQNDNDENSNENDNDNDDDDNGNQNDNDNDDDDNGNMNDNDNEDDDNGNQNDNDNDDDDNGNMNDNDNDDDDNGNMNDNDNDDDDDNGNQNDNDNEDDDNGNQNDNDNEDDDNNDNQNDNNDDDDNDNDNNENDDGDDNQNTNDNTNDDNDD